MKSEKSCGCVVIKDNKVLLVQQKLGNWGFPKGHVENNETEIQTAIREVKEETNLDVIIQKEKRYETKYHINDETLKTVIFFLATCDNTNVKPQEAEISDIEWLPFEKALDKLSFQNMKGILKQILKNEKL